MNSHVALIDFNMALTDTFLLGLMSVTSDDRIRFQLGSVTKQVKYLETLLTRK